MVGIGGVFGARSSEIIYGVRFSHGVVRFYLAEGRGRAQRAADGGLSLRKKEPSLEITLIPTELL